MHCTWLDFITSLVTDRPRGPNKYRQAKQRAAIARFERRTAPGARQCPSCLTHDTPMWRKGEWPYGSGVRILFCNSCGLRCKNELT